MAVNSTENMNDIKYEHAQQWKISIYAELQQSCYCSTYGMYIINACAFHERNVGLKQT